MSGIELRCPYCERTADFDLYARWVEREWLQPFGVKSEAGALGWIAGQHDRMGKALAEARLEAQNLRAELSRLREEAV